MQIRKLKWILLPITGILLTTWIAVGLQNRKVDDNALKNAGKAGNTDDWLTYGLNYQEQRYSLLKQIDATNVGRLGLAWTYEIGPGGGNQEGTPLVSNGVLYSITNWSVTFAVDLRTGKELWRYDPMVDRVNTHPCCGVVNRGLGIYNGKILVPVLDGRMVALDAATGKELWKVETVPLGSDYTVTMAPRIAKGKVIIGNAGSEFPVRGYVTAYDIETGKQAWRFYTVPGDPKLPFENKAMETAAKTWSGEFYKYGGGGTVWDGMTYDPDTNLIMFGTGNAGPWPSEFRQSKGLDNLYTASVVALNADTGEYKWHYQFVPEDSWDFDSVQQLTLADLRINGQNRKVVMQANKNGFFYVLDRTNGKVISAAPFAQVNWASEIDLKTGRPMTRPEAFYGRGAAVQIFPGPGGAHNWSPMSFNPTLNLMYIPTSASSSSTYRLPDSFTYTPGRTNMGVAFGGGGGGGGGRGGAGGGAPPPPPPGGIADPGAAAGAGFAVPTGPPPGSTTAPALPSVGPTDKDGKFYTGNWLVAIDPTTQKEKWRANAGGSIGGGTLTTAGNLVFQVTNQGHLLAYKADTGDKLLDLATNQTGNMGPPITFVVDNKQYIAVAGGAGPRGQGGGGGGGRGGAGGPGAAPGAPGAGAPPAAAPAGAPGGGAPAGAAAGPQRGAPAPAGPPAPVVLPRLYVYVLDGKAENPTPVPPPAPAGGGFGGGGAGGPGGPPPGGGAPAAPPAPGGRGGRGQ